MIDSEAPITSLDDDILDRGPLVCMIAEAINTGSCSQSMVVGISAPWGAGKTSFANLLEEEIGDSQTVVRFEPWMVNSVDALVREFFVEIGKVLTPTRDTKEDKESRARFYKYGAQVSLALSQVGKAANAARVPFIGLVEAGAKSVSEALDIAAKGLEAQATLPTLRESRAELRKILVGNEKRIVVLIDDLDRLEKDEVRTVFQLVKACADFPNVTYIFMYDWKQIEYALSAHVADPALFLEKVITRPFDLPEPTIRQKLDLIDSFLFQLGMPYSEKQSEERLELCIESVLLPGLRTIRQIKRFFVTLQTFASDLLSAPDRSIDLADFLALEYVRQSMPSVYEEIRTQEAPLTGRSAVRAFEPITFGPESPDWERLGIKPASDKGKLLQSVAKVWATGQDSAGRDRSERDRRFNSKHFRNVYLGFSDTRATISQADWLSFQRAIHSDFSKWCQLHMRNEESRSRWIEIIEARGAELDRSDLMTTWKNFLVWTGSVIDEIDPMQRGDITWATDVPRLSLACLYHLGDWGISRAIEEMADEIDTHLSLGLCIGFIKQKYKAAKWGETASSSPLEIQISAIKRRISRLISSDTFWEGNGVYEAVAAWNYLADDQERKAWHAFVVTSPLEFVHYVNKYLAIRHALTPDLLWGVGDDNFADALERIPYHQLSPPALAFRVTFLQQFHRGDQLR